MMVAGCDCVAAGCDCVVAIAVSLEWWIGGDARITVL